jgi:hypothetical protein
MDELRVRHLDACRSRTTDEARSSASTPPTPRRPSKNTSMTVTALTFSGSGRFRTAAV